MRGFDCLRERGGGGGGGGGGVSCASVCDVRKHVRASVRVRACVYIDFQCSVNVSGYY